MHFQTRLKVRMPSTDVALLTDGRYVSETAVPGDWYLQNILDDDGLLPSALARRGLTSRRVDWADRTSLRRVSDNVGLIRPLQRVLHQDRSCSRLDASLQSAGNGALEHGQALSRRFRANGHSSRGIAYPHKCGGTCWKRTTGGRR